jgi:hypothetical protein
MAEENERNEQNQQDTRTTSPDGSGRPNRRLAILLGLLGLALFALVWDFLIARPGVERAYAKVEEANIALNTSAQRVAFTNVDVEQLLGRAPSETFQKDGKTIDVYAWQAGIPLEFNGSDDRSPGIGRKTHDYYAVYEKRGPDLIFQTHFKFKLDFLAVDMPLSVTPEEDESAAETAAITVTEGDGPGDVGGDAQPDSDSPAEAAASES